MKIKCKVCGKRFLPCKENVYQAFEPVPSLKALTEITRTYDVTDCPRCGCQQPLKVRMPIYKERKSNDESDA